MPVFNAYPGTKIISGKTRVIDASETHSQFFGRASYPTHLLWLDMEVTEIGWNDSALRRLLQLRDPVVWNTVSSVCVGDRVASRVEVGKHILPHNLVLSGHLEKTTVRAFGDQRIPIG